MTPPDPPPTPWGTDKIPHGLWLVLAGVMPLVFASVSGNIWEDFFITFRCSLNLAEGNGLVYEVGRRLHVFTSPLGVLLPAGIAWGLSTDDPILVLWVFRLMAGGALVAAWWLASGSIKGPLSLAIAGSLWVLDPKLAAFSTNGMETALLVLFVIMSWHALLHQKFTLAGVALAGTLWARPDGFIFFGVIALATVIVPDGPRPKLKDWVRIAIVGAMLYTPWFAWAWAYYGSPIPNTILAKSGVATSIDREFEALIYPLDLLLGSTANHEVFLPGYYYFGGWHSALPWFGRLLTLLVIVPAFWNRCTRGARVAAIAFFLGGFYLELTTRAPWYYPAWAVLGYLSFAGLIPALLEKARTAGARGFVGAMAIGIIAIQLVLFICVTRQLQQQQRIIEWGLRAEIGHDLAGWAKTNKDTVFLEPLGYIGYFSGLAMRDTPGLSSPEVIALGQQGFITMPEIIGELHPDWVVLRVAELLRFSDTERANFDANYVYRGEYRKQEEIAAVSWLPGRGLLEFDSHFAVWERRDRNSIPKPEEISSSRLIFRNASQDQG